ncbi:hypothetical protein L2E82_18350 [Cichorium intybus]|uniref:Uncharacterized protein n=1 Tax=Cichorium intybus TaxID=13427 RepID=A0ACB9FB76_CICIN|nr:hypothetical protein L2E82_18350 [Cichorium intybus]
MFVNRWRNKMWEKAARIFIDYRCNSLSGGFHGFVPDQDFGRDTNRLDYFRVTALDVNGDDHLNGNVSYGDGGGGSDHGVVVGPRVEQEKGDVADGAHGGDMTPQVHVRTFDNTGRHVCEPVDQMLEHDSGSDDGDEAIWASTNLGIDFLDAIDLIFML